MTQMGQMDPGLVDMLVTLVLAAAGLYGLHRFLGYAEDRGWIYYRKKRGSYGGLGVTSNFLNMYDPSRKHLQQVVREGEWKRDEDDDGDDPSTPRRSRATDASLRTGPSTQLRTGPRRPHTLR